MKPNLDLVLFHFADVWQEDRQAALRTVESLLRDESACRARIEMLRRLQAHARERLSDLTPLPEPDDFSGEIAHLAAHGVDGAVGHSLVSPDRLAALTRDPHALWDAHRALVQGVPGRVPRAARSGSVAAIPAETGDTGETEPAARAEDTTVQPGAPQPGFTELVRSGRWEELEARLRPWLPGLLLHVGLPEDRADTLMRFIRDRAKRMSGRRFSELLPEWLEEFARGQGTPLRRALRSEEDWRDFVEPSAVFLVLRSGCPGEPEWAREFREVALRDGIRTEEELLVFEPAATAALLRDMEAFRSDLVFEVSQKKEEAQQLFETN